MDFSKGIIVGSDANQEWLIPWFWENYSKYNSYPVAFFDFGMSDEMVTFCKEKGLYFSLKEELPLKKEIKEEFYALFCEMLGDKAWALRDVWFKKPFACALSPFEKTIWIDSDCLVLKDLSELFSILPDDHELAIYPSRESDQVLMKLKGLYDFDETHYNSGVIVFRKGANFIADWTNASLSQENDFVGDDFLLSKILCKKGYKVFPLHEKYNFMDLTKDPRNYELMPDFKERVDQCLIHHYIGPTGKSRIYFEFFFEKYQLTLESSQSESS
jgi:hypothetical protein